MRAIKFRVWNELDSRPECRMTYQPTFTFDFRTIMPDGDEWDLPVMQFTGLSDRNGKEIYEGDVLDYGLDRVFYVSFSAGAGFVATFSGGQINRMIPIQNFEIIGNIHEHPHLLK